MSKPRLKETKAGWVLDPAGEEFDVAHEAGDMVCVQHPTHRFMVAIPKAALAPAASQTKEPLSGIQGKDGQ